MKKIVSVLLATLVLCSCFVLMVVNTSAGVEYPNGREAVLISSINGEPFVQLRIYNTYYSGMNCFLVRGVLKYYQNEPDLFPLVESHCSWVISYTTGTSVSGGFWTGPAVPDSRLVFEYSRNNISWDSTKTVTEIWIDHNLFANDNPCAYLYSVYTPE